MTYNIILVLGVQLNYLIYVCTVDLWKHGIVRNPHITSDSPKTQSFLDIARELVLGLCLSICMSVFHPPSLLPSLPSFLSSFLSSTYISMKSWIFILYFGFSFKTSLGYWVHLQHCFLWLLNIPHLWGVFFVAVWLIEVIVLISGRRDANVNLLPFGTLGKGKARGPRKSRWNLLGVDSWEVILFFFFYSFGGNTVLGSKFGFCDFLLWNEFYFPFWNLFHAGIIICSSCRMIISLPIYNSGCSKYFIRDSWY